MAYTDSIGTTLTFGGTAVAGLTSIQPFSAARESLDISSMATAGAYRTYLPSGLTDAGTIELEGIEDTADSGQDLLRAGLVATTASTVVITLPSAVTITVSAFVTNYTPSLSIDAARTFTCSLKCTGAPAYSA